MLSTNAQSFKRTVEAGKTWHNYHQEKDIGLVRHVTDVSCLISRFKDGETTGRIYIWPGPVSNLAISYSSCTVPVQLLKLHVRELTCDGIADYSFPQNHQESQV
jgi:hypothetical protein